MKKYHRSIVGRSYAHRVKEILRIYDEHSRSGLSNREILRRYIWPLYPICEKTFYNIINASADPRVLRQQEELEPSAFAVLNFFGHGSGILHLIDLMHPGSENCRLARRTRRWHTLRTASRAGSLFSRRASAMRSATCCSCALP